MFISQAEMARRIGVSPQTIRRYRSRTGGVVTGSGRVYFEESDEAKVAEAISRVRCPICRAYLKPTGKTSHYQFRPAHLECALSARDAEYKALFAAGDQ